MSHVCICTYMYIHACTQTPWPPPAGHGLPNQWSPWPSQEFCIHFASVALSPAERPTEAKFMQNCWLGLGLHGLVGKSIALAMQSLVVVMGSVARAKTFACSFLPGTLGGFLLEHTLEIPL